MLIIQAASHRMLKVEMEVKVDGFHVGTVVSLHYKADADTKDDIRMNFLSGQSDYIFHFNPRYHREQALVLNTRNSALSWPWGEEERPCGFPIEIGMWYVLILLQSAA